MSDEIKEKNDTTEIPAMADEVKRIQLVKYRRPEELEIRALKKKVNRLTKLLLVFFIIILGLGGFTFGYVVDRVKEDSTPSVSYHVSEKFDRIMDIMETSWFFSTEIENAEERFLDQAITGITTNEEDPHTAYMSAAEIETFFQGINQNFVGIGVQFLGGEGLNMIQRVFPDSPAEEAGVLAGDIIYKVDGVLVEGMTSSEIVELVRGEEGDPVTIIFLRDGEEVELEIIRRELAVTVFDEMLDGEIGYLEIQQFGDTTAKEAETYLKNFVEQGAKGLIIDLRDDGGGYLTTLQEVGGLFLGKDVTVIQEETTTGVKEVLVTTTDKVWNDTPIVILVNENTASASEAFTLAMMEEYPNVTVVGVTTYGKGTVQITRTFEDGSALKYTTAKWMSPNGVWINNVGIEPDVYVEEPAVLNELYEQMEEGETLAVDTVDGRVRTLQMCLEYLGYDVDRTDGYFSTETEEALKQFQNDRGLEVTGILDEDSYNSALGNVILDWNMSTEHDVQLQTALEILHG